MLIQMSEQHCSKNQSSGILSRRELKRAKRLTSLIANSPSLLVFLALNRYTEKTLVLYNFYFSNIMIYNLKCTFLFSTLISFFPANYHSLKMVEGGRAMVSLLTRRDEAPYTYGISGQARHTILTCLDSLSIPVFC